MSEVIVEEGTENVEENVTENVETPNTFTREDLAEFDELGLIFVDRVNEQIGELNTLNTDIKKASGDIKEVTESVITSDDPEIVKLRETADKAKAKAKAATDALNELADAKAKEQISATVDDEALKVKQLAADKLSAKVKASKKMLTLSYPESDINGNVLSLLDEEVKVGKTSNTAPGEGGKRLRNFEITVNGKRAEMKNPQNKLVSTFTAASKDLGGFPVPKLQEMYMSHESVNTTDPDKFPIGTPVEFTVTNNGTTYTVVATKVEQAAQK